MKFPDDLRYAATHEWVRTEPDGTLSIGISDHAQDALGDLVFVELPAVGRTLAAGESCAVVESVKAASDVYAPVASVVVAANTALAESPESLNRDPYGSWLFRVKPSDPAAVSRLMDAATYRLGLDKAAT